MSARMMPVPRVCAVCLHNPCACPDMCEDSTEGEDSSAGVSWGQFVHAIADSRRLAAELEVIAAEWRALG